VCRLFALSGGPRRVRATFWLVEAPDSLAEQSRRNPDGYGLGTFDENGKPRVDKRPVAAYEDEAFGREAREACSRTFLAHVRHATTGGLTPQNTHPFELRSRLFAHNGVVEGLPEIEAHLGAAGMRLVAGDTDSERVLALITREIDAAGGDIADGIAAAVGWLAATVPIFSLNFILTTQNEVWALRYPEANELWLLEREAGGARGDRHFDAGSAPGTVRVRSGELRDRPAVILASEPMDEHAGWTLMEPGELLRVRPGLEVERRLLLPEPPAHALTLADLAPAVAVSQAAGR
jgi:predicted glutamine amidotransferase